MMKNIATILLVILYGLCTSCFAQGIVSRCETCGLATSKCKYKGEHPKCNTCGLLIEKCKYKGKHPKKETRADRQEYTNLSDNNTMPQSNRVLTGETNGHKWVDLGLSVKWATQNVGAKTVSDYGDYFHWCAPTTTINPDWEKYIDNLTNSCDKTSDNANSERFRDIEITDGYDTAHENWGDSWRMPTKAEFEELIEKCQWNWTKDNGVEGFKITGPSGESIFLPSGGWQNSDGKFDCVGEQGYYWGGSYMGKTTVTSVGLYFNSPLRESQHRLLEKQRELDKPKTQQNSDHSTILGRPKGRTCYANPYRGHMVRPVTK